MRPQTAKYGIDQFLPWKHWHMKFTALGLFKIIFSALTIFPRMFECADKFIPSTPYLFVSFMIFLNFDGSLHFGLPLLNNMVTPSFFRIFQMIYPYRHFLKILSKSYRYICPTLAQVWPLCPRQPNMVSANFCLESIDIWNLQLLDYSKSFLVHWEYFPGCSSVLTNSLPSHHTFSYLLWFFSILTAAYILVCHSLTNMVTPSFFRIFSNDIPI